MGAPDAARARRFARKPANVGRRVGGPGRQQADGSADVAGDLFADGQPGPLAHAEMRVGGQWFHAVEALGERQPRRCGQHVGRPAANGVVGVGAQFFESLERKQRRRTRHTSRYALFRVDFGTFCPDFGQ